jgi:hypothetical protein
VRGADYGHRRRLDEWLERGKCTSECCVARSRHVLQHFFEMFANVLDGFEVRAFDLDVDRRTHARGEYVDAGLWDPGLFEGEEDQSGC